MNSPSGPMADAELELAEAVKKFEGLFVEVVEGLPQRISQTGEAYTEITHCGARIDDGAMMTVVDWATGKRVPGFNLHIYPENAVSEWLEEAKKFAVPFLAGKPTLYWRTRPEIDYGQVDIFATNGLFRVPTWKVYSRLLISNNPVLGHVSP
jgi:hypothetical protein